MLVIGCFQLSASEIEKIYQDDASVTAQTSATRLTPTHVMYGLKAPVKIMYEWSIPIETLADNPRLNGADRKAVSIAIDEGVLEEMTTNITEYEFNKDGKIDWVQSYDGDTPVKVRIWDLPGVFKVVFENGLPYRFTLVEDPSEGEDNQGICLDAYEIGLEEFSITYGSDGLPSELFGKAMPFFAFVGDDQYDDQYKEKYSDYKFDKNGNWTCRTVTTRLDKFKQFRAYEY